MTQVLITESYLDDIADAIRDKNGSEDLYTPAQMASAIEALPEPVEPDLVTKAINTNGTYSAEDEGHDGYSQVAVQVPNSYAAGDEGKVVSSGALVSQTSTTKSANGTYDTTLNNEVVVDVPNTYTASDEGKVVDNGALVTQGSLEITQNGTFDTTLISEVVVNVEDEELRQMVYNVYPTEEVSGDLVTITDGAGDIPVKDMVIKVNPVQSGSGDPSPTNIRPISGWTGCKVTRTGKNIFGGTLLRDAIKAAMSSATIDDEAKTISFGAGATASQTITDFCGFSGKFKENTPYTFILTGKNGNDSKTAANMKIRYTDGTSSPSFSDFPTAGQKSTIVYTTPSNKTVASLFKSNMNTGTILYYEESGIFEGELTADDFVSYVGNTYDITFPSEAGTVYGGTVDVTAGTMKVTKVITDLSQLTWTSTSWGGVRCDITNAKGATDSTYIADIMAEQYKPSTYADVSRQTPETVCLGSSVSNRNRLYVYSASSPTGKVVYPLIEPIEITLDPVTIRTLLGLNNLWADCGPIEELEYRADIKLYIENLTKPDDDMIADSAIASGTYFMVNNKLYLSTTSIANGAIITPGTNCIETTLTEALNTINT